MTCHPRALCAPPTSTIIITPDGYAVDLDTFQMGVSCDALGTPVAGQLGGSGVVRVTASAQFRSQILTPVDSAPGPGEFCITSFTPVNCTATKVSAATIRVDTMSADFASITILFNLEGLVTTITKVFSVTKSKAGPAGPSPIDFNIELEGIADGAYTLMLDEFTGGTIKKISLKSNSGTAKFTLRINGVPVTGLVGVDVNSVKTRFNASGLNVLADTDTLDFLLFDTASLNGFYLSVDI